MRCQALRSHIVQFWDTVLCSTDGPFFLSLRFWPHCARMTLRAQALKRSRLVDGRNHALPPHDAALRLARGRCSTPMAHSRSADPPLSRHPLSPKCAIRRASAIWGLGIMWREFSVAVTTEGAPRTCGRWAPRLVFFPGTESISL